MPHGVPTSLELYETFTSRRVSLPIRKLIERHRVWNYSKLSHLAESFSIFENKLYDTEFQRVWNCTKLPGLAEPPSAYVWSNYSDYAESLVMSRREWFMNKLCKWVANELALWCCLTRCCCGLKMCAQFIWQCIAEWLIVLLIDWFNEWLICWMIDWLEI